MTVVADDDQYVPPSGVIAVILASMSLQAGGYSTPQTSARLYRGHGISATECGWRRAGGTHACLASNP
eukprot:1138891-Pelagomonas_calceolata.AAC.1